MWNHFCSSFFVGGRKSGDKGKQYDRAGFEGNEKTVQPRCARKHLTTAMESRELHLIPWLRQDLLLRSKVNTLKPASG